MPSPTPPRDPLRFEARFAAAGALLSLVEVVAIGLPLYAFFRLEPGQRWLLLRALPVVGPGAWLIWWVAMRYWRQPLDRAVRARRAGAAVPPEALALAAHVTMTLPRRAALLRAGVMTAAALFVSLLLLAKAGLPARVVVTVVSVFAFHGLTVEVFRALAWARVLDGARSALVPEPDPLSLFRDLYLPRLWRAALASGALAVVAIAAFAYFFLPIEIDDYRQLALYYPPTVALLAGVWLYFVGRLARPLAQFLAAVNAPDPRRRPGRDDPAAPGAFRTAQLLPYKLGLLKLGLAVFGQAVLCVQAILLHAIDGETAALLYGEALMVTVGATLYEILWHRATLRPILAQLGARYRSLAAPPDTRTPLSLRTKMVAAFGVLLFFACGLSLFWSFVQYKTLATRFIEHETELRRDRVAAMLEGRLDGPPAESRALVAEALRGEARDGTTLMFLPVAAAAPPLVVASAAGGARPETVRLPAAEREHIERAERGAIDLPAVRLTGSFVKLVDKGGVPRGALVVLAPGYRGGGAPIARPVWVLVFFFVLLVAASMGIVVLVASDLTRPIRLLEQRAGAIARGDFNRPAVQLAADLDEVGRLALAFEEMRQALDEKLRSSTEINLSLEQEVSRRTAELSRRNRELADALAALQRTQAELLRSEKMASMGRLVAGIAHEINNPVNAVVNSVGPLEGALEELIASEGPARDAAAVASSDELREMLRVIRSGASRTKQIVQALHNYSRGEDTAQTQVDIHRGLDDSLELLRHHLRHGIRVERAYGPVGRIQGNEGQLRQVFMNLLTNAAQAIGDRPEGGTIQLSTERAGDQLVVRIADDGSGIPEDILPRIFDPFFTTKDVGQGSGLGLSIVHGIVERHGGTITVDSHVGQGTTFTVTLPIAPAPAKADRVQPRA